jgi:hypothetical protein
VLDFPTCGKSRGQHFRSLRTQQRAYAPDAIRTRFLLQAAVLTSRSIALRELVSVPPLSYLHETFARDEAFWTEPAYGPA